VGAAAAVPIQTATAVEALVVLAPRAEVYWVATAAALSVAATEMGAPEVEVEVALTPLVSAVSMSAQVAEEPVLSRVVTAAAASAVAGQAVMAAEAEVALLGLPAEVEAAMAEAVAVSMAMVEVEAVRFSAHLSFPRLR
jgi:hypothetical protein